MISNMRKREPEGVTGVIGLQFRDKFLSSTKKRINFRNVYGIKCKWILEAGADKLTSIFRVIFDKVDSTSEIRNPDSANEPINTITRARPLTAK